MGWLAHNYFSTDFYVWSIAICVTVALRFWGGPLLNTWRTFTKYRVAPLLTAFGIMWLAQFCIAQHFGWPVPAIQDEFSYLLAADTFASGRATNPTHAAWEFLETYHVIWQPTYQSKFPPGNGLALALGQILCGRPIVGVWIFLALSAAGLYWMLRGFLPNRWAAWGTLILIVNWRVSRVWGQSFFGAGPALLAATLVFGAWVRLLKRPKFGDAVCLGSGLVIWMITRPYEGLIASLPVLVTLAAHFLQAPVGEKVKYSRRVIFPTAVLVVTGLGMLGWYHQQVTGSVWKWPYQVYEETYTRRTGPIATLFFWTPLGERKRTIPTLETESTANAIRMAEDEPLRYAFRKMAFQWWFHLGIVWTVPLLIAVFSFRRWTNIFAACTVALVGFAILFQRTSGMPHYAAPVHPLMILLIVQGLRQMSVWRWGNWSIGRDLVMFLMCFSTICYLLPLVQRLVPNETRNWAAERARIQSELEERPGKDLVIVRYDRRHSMHEEWVYNQADIDGSEVVWARELGSPNMSVLFEQFADRQIWLIEPDRTPLDLKIYSLDRK